MSRLTCCDSFSVQKFSGLVPSCLSQVHNLEHKVRQVQVLGSVITGNSHLSKLVE
jgi:hypothetical protein